MKHLNQLRVEEDYSITDFDWYRNQDNEDYVEFRNRQGDVLYAERQENDIRIRLELNDGGEYGMSQNFQNWEDTKRMLYVKSGNSKMMDRE